MSSKSAPTGDAPAPTMPGDNLSHNFKLDAADRRLVVAEMNYLIEYGWRLAGIEPDGKHLWAPPAGYPESSTANKLGGAHTAHAVNSQRQHAAAMRK